MAHAVNEPGYETRDAGVKGILWAGGILAVLAVVAALVAFGLFQFLYRRPQLVPPNPMAAEQQEFPTEPRLEANPAAGYQELRSTEQQRLDSYGWVDREKGIVHIPIERAMEIQLERGFPTRTEGTK